MARSAYKTASMREPNTHLRASEPDQYIGAPGIRVEFAIATSIAAELKWFGIEVTDSGMGNKSG